MRRRAAGSGGRGRRPPRPFPVFPLGSRPRFPVSGFRFPVSGFRFPVSGFRFPVSGFRFHQLIISGPVGEHHHGSFDSVQVVAVTRGEGKVELLLHGLFPRRDDGADVTEELGDALPEVGGPCPGEHDLHAGVGLQQGEDVEQPGQRGHGVRHHEDPATVGSGGPGRCRPDGHPQPLLDRHAPSRYRSRPFRPALRRNSVPNGPTRPAPRCRPPGVAAGTALPSVSPPGPQRHR